MKRIWPLTLLMLLTLSFACGGGEGTDRPEDCGEGEYFDEANELCVTCPSVVEPECMPGCDVEVVVDNRECPVLECEEDCEGCEEDEEWDEEQQRCLAG